MVRIAVVLASEAAGPGSEALRLKMQRQAEAMAAECQS